MKQEVSLDTGIVFDIKRFALHDGPGVRTTVFLKGCPLTCWFCHNPESQATELELVHWKDRCDGCQTCVSRCEQQAIQRTDSKLMWDKGACIRCGVCSNSCYNEALELMGREMTLSQVMEEIEKETLLHDESGGGVTFSGGEPLLQPEFLYNLLVRCREHAINTAVDTCGFVTWITLEKISQKTDLFLYDLKLMEDKKHQEITGVSNRIILENLENLADLGKDVLVRIPVFPGVNDDTRNIQALGAFLQTLKKRYPVDLLPYHNMGQEKYPRMNRQRPGPCLNPPNRSSMERIADQLASFGLKVSIGDEPHGHK